MHEDILADQRDLVSLVEAEGWDVTETELSVYESPWIDEDHPEATLTITARRGYPDHGEKSGDGDGAADGDSPYRVK